MPYARTTLVAPSTVQGPYSITFPFLESSDLRASVNGTEVGVTFTVVGADLTFVTPTVSIGDTLVFYRETERAEA